VIRLLCVIFLACLSLGLDAAQFNGVTYQGVRATGRQLGLEPTYASNLKTATFAGRGHNVRFYTHQKYTTIDGVKVWMGWPMAINKNLLYLSVVDVQKTLTPLLSDQKFPYKKLWHIVIDPGHGGKDTGARNPALGLNEKTLTLDIAKRLQQLLEGFGYKTTLTRDSDRFVDLKERARFANTLKADLFISIHLNAVDNQTVKGIETFCYTPKGMPSSARGSLASVDKRTHTANTHDINNLWLAYEIQKSMKSSLPSTDRGVKRARFTVLEDLKCPGVLVEGGFVSHPTEGARLASGMYRQQFAEAILKGVRNYHKRCKASR